MSAICHPRRSHGRPSAAGEDPKEGGEERDPPSGDHQHAHQHQDGTPQHLDRSAVAPEPPEESTRPRDTEREQEERDAASEYTRSKAAPRHAPSTVAAAVRIPARTGPMHGVHPIAKAIPRGSAPAGPGRIRARSKRRSRYRKGIRSSPIVARPITITKMPATLPRTMRFRRMTAPSSEAAAPIRVNVTANPATNRPAASIVLLRIATVLDV